MLGRKTAMNKCSVFGLVLVSMFCVLCANKTVNADGAKQSEAVFANWPISVEVQHKPGTIWWTPGSAWDKDNIDFNLEKLKEGGIGTANIVPIYSATTSGGRDIEFLSDKWLENLKYLLKKAKELGMQIDMTTGSGWCFGGPNVPGDHRSTHARLAGAESLELGRHRGVKRAGPGGGGPMLDPFSPKAMKEYLKRFDKAFEGFEMLPRGQYHDSYEYDANFSVEIPEAFKKQHGYDMYKHLPVLFGKTELDDTAKRIRYDYSLTAARMHQEYIKVWADWAESKGMHTREQAHNSPSVTIDTYAEASIPETEYYGSHRLPIPGFRSENRWCTRKKGFEHWVDPRMIFRLPSSAAHVAHEQGNQLVSSESCTLMREHWHGTLAHIKYQMDQLFLTGINHVFYHGTCYSPKEAPWPGWYFYASTQVNSRNSIYHDLPILNQYIARCQSVLQSGGPANDILLYWPVHDQWMDGGPLIFSATGVGWLDRCRLRKIGAFLDDKGYAFDMVSDQMLDTIQYQNGKLVAPGGTYKVVVVPECQYLPATTAKHLADLAANGAKIIFGKQLPTDVPGLGYLESRRAVFAKASARLKDSAMIGDIATELTKAGVKRETLTDHGLRYIRREIDGEYWYYIANHTAKDYSGWLELATKFRSAILYNPMTGDAATLPSKKEQVYLEIPAGRSFIVRASNAKSNIKPYIPTKATGRKIALKGTWQIEFIDGGPTLPETYSTDSLSSWTGAPDEKAQAFAGTARYKLTFNLSDLSADDYMLDLGDVRESARVKINGVEVAKLVAFPMRTKVGRYLTKGANTIKVEVTNLAANRIRDLARRKGGKGNWKIMSVRVDNAAGWPLQASGLLGPVTLSPLSRIQP